MGARAQQALHTERRGTPGAPRDLSRTRTISDRPSDCMIRIKPDRGQRDGKTRRTPLGARPGEARLRRQRARRARCARIGGASQRSTARRTAHGQFSATHNRPSHWHTLIHQQWDKVENKPGVVLYGAGAVVLLWLSSTIVGAINSIPLLPKLMELVGLGYTAWFTWR